jgi:DNA-binding transcriptional regulator LsrR (DeoR family)
MGYPSEASMKFGRNSTTEKSGNYIPICKDGSQNKAVEDKLIAIKLDDFRQIARQQNRYVIAIAGGEHKREAIEAALANPYFNVLVTDEKIARYLLQGR